MDRVFEQIEPPANKKFGFTFFATLLVVSVVAITFRLDEFLIAGILFIAFSVGITAVLDSEKLTVLNLAWFKVGLFLAKVSNPILLGIVYLCLITPTAIIRRNFGVSPISLRKRSSSSYWIERKDEEAKLRIQSFRNQY